MDLGRIEWRIRQQENPTTPADIVEPAFPSFGRPVGGTALYDHGKRCFVHRILAS
jgi:hypothetical protein